MRATVSTFVGVVGLLMTRRRRLCSLTIGRVADPWRLRNTRPAHRSPYPPLEISTSSRSERRRRVGRETASVVLNALMVPACFIAVAMFAGGVAAARIWDGATVAEVVASPEDDPGARSLTTDSTSPKVGSRLTSLGSQNGPARCTALFRLRATRCRPTLLAESTTFPKGRPQGGRGQWASVSA